MDWVFYSRNNQEMVDKFTRLGIIESSEVERAFRCVSRAAFVPDDMLEDAFKDTPLRGSQLVHLSAPHMYAAILEELELDVGMSSSLCCLLESRFMASNSSINFYFLLSFSCRHSFLGALSSVRPSFLSLSPLVLLFSILPSIINLSKFSPCIM